MSISFKEKIILIFLAISALLVLYLYNGTGQEADSVTHYLFAKYAPIHPELYLDHWAKPVFTLLASPFAQFGFLGVKFFNVLCTLLTCWQMLQISKKLKLEFPYLSSLFYFIFPVTLLTTFSGLTEPLFALALSLSLNLILDKKVQQAAILLSFTPFIRSEGLVIIGVFACYFLYLRNWRCFVFLGVGHLLMGLAGWFYYGNLLWVFNKIPYASFNSPYGSGTLFHFADQLIYLTGVPLLVLFLGGCFALIFKKFDLNADKKPILYLIILLFLAFFIAHSLFWYFGIFNSMGLKRVFAAITPLMGIICLIGFNFVFSFLKKPRLRTVFQGLFMAYSLLFLFTSNPASVNWNKDLNLSPPQEMAVICANYIEDNFDNNLTFQYTDPFLSHALNIDPFDSKVYRMLTKNSIKSLSQNELIIWENWHAITDQGVGLEELENNSELELKQSFESYEYNRPVIYKIFLKKPTH